MTVALGRSFRPNLSVAPKRFYLPELDALRFFAFLAVFVCHVAHLVGHDSPLFVSGSFGVDLFFALSAFLISELLLRERETRGTIDVRAFWLRRILRIWPLYFMILAIATIVGDVNRYQLALCLFFAGNFGFIVWGQPALIGPLWSISVEEQFYVAWPLLAKRLNRRGVATFALFLWLFSIGARLVIVRLSLPPELLVNATICRLDPIAAGLLLSSAGGHWRARFWLDRFAMIAIGLILCLISGVWLFGASSPSALSKPAMIFAFAIVSVGCLLLLVGTLGAGGIVRNSWLVYLGRISYGLYVFHMPALILSDTLAPSLMIPIGAALTLILAAASYRWLESPFLRLKAHFEHLPSRPV